MVNQSDERDKRVLGYFRDKSNQFIFKRSHNNDMTLDDLKKEFENRDDNPYLIAEKDIIKFFVNDFKEKELNLSEKEIKEILEDAIYRKYLYRWGEGNMFIVTKELLDFIASLDNPYIRFDTIEPAQLTPQPHNQMPDLPNYPEEIIENYKTLQCPYCKSQTKFITEDDFHEISCEICSKNYKIITGIIRDIQMKTSSIGKNHKIPVTIILTNNNNNNKIISFITRKPRALNENHEISFLFKRKFLSGNYPDNPHKIINWTTGEVYEV